MKKAEERFTTCLLAHSIVGGDKSTIHHESAWLDLATNPFHDGAASQHGATQSNQKGRLD
jgi:hypothetical protein